MATPKAAAALHVLLLCLALPASAAREPDAPAAIPTAQDTRYPGTLLLEVDLRDVNQKIFRVHEVIPVGPGPLTLLYPKWIPGEHGPTGTLDALAGIQIHAAGRSLPWRRDLREMYALRLTVPVGVDHLDLDFQMLSPSSGGDFGTSVSVTERLLDLEWNQVLFYPAGYFARDIQIRASVQLPEGWQSASALRADAPSGTALAFQSVDLETLVDSPLIAGRNFRRVELTGPGVAAVCLDVVADRPENLSLSKTQIEHQAALVQEAGALFGAYHYRHYDFLLTLSDATGHFGLEHHQSSDDRLDADYFTDADDYAAEADLMPHEYVHSWNGKYRRPNSLIIPDYGEPMRGDLLWVYEGLTQYLGEVLAGRAGYWTPEQYRDQLALTAAHMSQVAGRTWRPLQDTADEAQVLYNVPQAWSSWRRRVDFYEEGSLLWLDVDTKLRELSHDRRSIDDFARLFYGGSDGKVTVEGYDFKDVVATLEQVQSYDWAGLLKARLNSTEAAAPLDGVTRGGWRLVYSDQANPVLRAHEQARKYTELSDSLGIRIDEDSKPGAVLDVLWQSPAFDAGLAPDVRLIAVNGDKYGAEVLKDAITASHQDPAKPIELLVQSGDVFRTVTIDYHGGLRYPHLQRLEGATDRLSQITQARRPAAPAPAPAP
jgi:predicted metalloprotease with PDZ domain